VSLRRSLIGLDTLSQPFGFPGHQSASRMTYYPEMASLVTSAAQRIEERLQL